MSEVAVQQSNSLSLIDSVDINAVTNTLAKINQFQMIVQNTLKANHDYGVIPGTSKPTLLKPGAEKIQMLFGVTSEYEVTERIQDYDKGFFAFTVVCRIYKNDVKITEGVGHCNTREKKYVNQDPYTLANTCLKMAKKRAQVDATLTIASLSEVFTQDMEDLQGYLQQEQMENMTPTDAANMKVTFGKHKGKMLREIHKGDKSYISWLAEKAKDPAMKQAANIVLEAVKESNGQKPQNSQQEPSPPQQEEEPPFDDGQPIEMSDDDIPF